MGIHLLERRRPALALIAHAGLLLRGGFALRSSLVSLVAWSRGVSRALVLSCWRARRAGAAAVASFKATTPRPRAAGAPRDGGAAARGQPRPRLPSSGAALLPMVQGAPFRPT